MPVNRRPLVALTFALVAVAGRLRARAGDGSRARGEPVALVIEPDAGPDAILDLIARRALSVWMEMYLLTDARGDRARWLTARGPVATSASSSSPRRT